MRIGELPGGAVRRFGELVWQAARPADADEQLRRLRERVDGLGLRLQALLRNLELAGLDPDRTAHRPSSPSQCLGS